MKLTRFKPCVGYDGEAGMMLSEDGGWLLAEHVEAAIAALEGQIEKLKADAKIGDEMLEALEAKYEGCPHHPITEASVCGCSYDRIGDVCAFHAPALASAKQRVGELEEEVQGLKESLALSSHLESVTVVTMPTHVHRLVERIDEETGKGGSGGSMKNCEMCGGENLPQRELAWLIEADGCYWDGHFADSRAFTRDVNLAVRFARFQDAEAVKHWLLQAHSFALRTTQHAWINATHQ